MYYQCQQCFRRIEPIESGIWRHPPDECPCGATKEDFVEINEPDYQRMEQEDYYNRTRGV